jgi:hypothetical protein
MKKKKYPLKKNPFFLIPVAMPIVYTVVGSMLVGIGGYMGYASYNVVAENERIRDLDKLQNDLANGIEKYQKGLPTNFDIIPNSLWSAPTSVKQSSLKASWFYMMALQKNPTLSNQIKQELLNNAIVELNFAKNIWDEQVEYENTSDNALIYPLVDVLDTWKKLGIDALPNMAGYVKHLKVAIDPNSIAEQVEMNKKNALSTLLPEALEETAKDIAEQVEETMDTGSKFWAIIKGLFTGKRPEFMTPKEWRKLRIRIFAVIGGGVGLYLTPYVLPIVRSLVTDWQESRQQKRKAIAQK